MKPIYKYLLLTTLILINVGCKPLIENGIRGELKVNPKWGSSINLYDVESKSYKELQAGKYNLHFPKKWIPFTDPKIQVKDQNNNLVLTLAIPRSQIKDDGTFEIRSMDNKNALQFNVLGGRREIILKRERFSVIREYCTYTESYPCMGTCTDSKGNSYSCMQTCTRTVSGDQDVLYENQQVKSFYRILFDGSDIINAASFDGESEIKNRTVQLNSTSCS